MKNFIGIREEWIRPLPSLKEMFGKESEAASSEKSSKESKESKDHGSKKTSGYKSSKETHKSSQG